MDERGHKACYGTMLPARVDGPAGESFRGKAVSLTLIATDGVTSRQVEVNYEEWDDCLRCPEFDHCYKLCSARIALQSGDLLSKNLLTLDNRSAPRGGGGQPEPPPRLHKGQTQNERKLTEELILEWADEFFVQFGFWPKATSGPVPAEPTTTWAQISMALRMGHRGLKGGLSLPQLLRSKRGTRNRMDLPPLTYGIIYQWIDAHFERTGRCPDWSSPEKIPGTEGESWRTVEYALREGTRGLSGGESVRHLLRDYATRRPGLPTTPLKKDEILGWAECHHKQFRRWPVRYSGPVRGVAGENWLAIDLALKLGLRGLPHGSSLNQLIRTAHGEVLSRGPAKFSVHQVYGWCEAFRDKHGVWPTRRSGRIPEAPSFTFRAIDSALRKGRYSLPAGSCLEKVISEGGKSSS